MSFQFSLFSQTEVEKPSFFFTVLHYPKELMSYCKKSQLPDNVGVYTTAFDEVQAENFLKMHGVKNPLAYISFVKKNSGKWIAFLEYSELPIF